MSFLGENIKRLLEDCFAHLGEVALYKSKDKSYMVQVLKQETDKLYEIGEGQFVGETLVLEISAFDLLQPIVDTVLQVNKKITKIVQAVS